MSIEKDEHGDRWLLCDLCHCEEEERHYWSAGLSVFYGIGLPSAKLVRSVASAMENWRRRKLITCFDPLESRYFDLCPACQQPEVLAMRIMDISTL